MLGTLETYYRPLAIVSFMLDAQWGRENPAIYHLTNVILHAVTVVLLGYLLIVLGARERTALVVAALFAVHPLNTQAVAWIAGRNELLLGVFVLVAFLSYVSADGPAVQRGSRSTALPPPWPCSPRKRRRSFHSGLVCTRCSFAR